MMDIIMKKIETDRRILQAKKEKRKKTHKAFLLYGFVVLFAAIFLCWRADFPVWAWILTGFSFVIAVALLLFFVCRLQKPKIFWGKIERMEENREIVPRKGSGAIFGTSHKYALDEVYKLLIAITNENQETEVIFCSPQYEKILKIGDTLLTHSALPYPAHLSNPTKCICMHCGTMQASENQLCISCQADLYNLFTIRKE